MIPRNGRPAFVPVRRRINNRPALVEPGTRRIVQMIE